MHSVYCALRTNCWCIVMCRSPPGLWFSQFNLAGPTFVVASPSSGTTSNENVIFATPGDPTHFTGRLYYGTAPSGDLLRLFSGNSLVVQVRVSSERSESAYKLPKRSPLAFPTRTGGASRLGGNCTHGVTLLRAGGKQQNRMRQRTSC